jgi:hypothetical protein
VKTSSSVYQRFIEFEEKAASIYLQLASHFSSDGSGNRMPRRSSADCYDLIPHSLSVQGGNGFVDLSVILHRRIGERRRDARHKIADDSDCDGIYSTGLDPLL